MPDLFMGLAMPDERGNLHEMTPRKIVCVDVEKNTYYAQERQGFSSFTTEYRYDMNSGKFYIKQDSQADYILAPRQPRVIIYAEYSDERKIRIAPNAPLDEKSEGDTCTDEN